jgi:hypothetical protein
MISCRSSAIPPQRTRSRSGSTGSHPDELVFGDDLVQVVGHPPAEVVVEALQPPAHPRDDRHDGEQAAGALATDLLDAPLGGALLGGVRGVGGVTPSHRLIPEDVHTSYTFRPHPP